MDQRVTRGSEGNLGAVWRFGPQRGRMRRVAGTRGRCALQTGGIPHDEIEKDALWPLVDAGVTGKERAGTSRAPLQPPGDQPRSRGPGSPRRAWYDAGMEVHSGWDHAPLREVIAAGEVTCSLEEGALLLARQEDPDLDPGPFLRRIDAIAELVRPMLSERPDPPEIVGGVNDVLFRDLGFQGNTDDYYHPRHSLL